MANPRSICIHAHFYQPSREDPFTGVIPEEAGAHPYPNWNEYIFQTCYKPNIEEGNFENISFNLGPTLTLWLETNHPKYLKRIVEADGSNLEQYGVGNAMAQSYHHSILPLATREDKRTEIRWGIYSFEKTFHREPKGIWLPETAVDLETLKILAEEGIEFTILANWQVKEEGQVSNTGFTVELPHAKKINIFVYNSMISSRLSFDPQSTSNADYFVEKHILNEFNNTKDEQFLLAATDGELYGHHQVFREKFLAYLLNGSIHKHKITPSFPARYLDEHRELPATEIVENTSWSCHHGIDRWKQGCWCTPNSVWKKPFREALDKTAKWIDEIYIEKCVAAGIDPWELRDAYIEVVSGDIDFHSWFARFYKGTDVQVISLFDSLLQAQTQRLKMFTSCGWFFDDYDRIEPRNNTVYAAAAVCLTCSATGIDLSDRIVPLLRNVSSWKTGLTADIVFQQAIDHFRSL